MLRSFTSKKPAEEEAVDSSRQVGILSALRRSGNSAKDESPPLATDSSNNSELTSKASCCLEDLCSPAGNKRGMQCVSCSSAAWPSFKGMTRGTGSTKNSVRTALPIQQLALEETLTKVIEQSETRLAARVGAVEAVVERRHSEIAVILAGIMKHAQQQQHPAPQWRQSPSSSSGSSLHGSISRTAAEQRRAENARVVQPPSAADDYGEGHATDQVKEMWSLVESDDGIRLMLKDMREKVDRRAHGRFLTSSRESEGEGGSGSSAGRAGSSRRLNKGRSSSSLAAALTRSNSTAGSSTAGNTSAVVRWSERNPAGGASTRSLSTWLTEASTRQKAAVKSGVSSLGVAMRKCCGPVLHPDSRFRTTWNVLLALLICYSGVVVPMEIAFERDLIISMCRLDHQSASVTDSALNSITYASGECPSFLVWFSFNLIIDTFFILDVIINFRTGFIVEGHFVSDDWLAAKNYFFGTFFIDFLGSFPLNLILWAVQSSEATTSGEALEAGRANRVLRLFRLMKLAKLARLVKLKSYMQYLALLVKFNPALLRIFQLWLWAIFCCHWFGCVWWFIADMELTFPVDFISPHQLRADAAAAGFDDSEIDEDNLEELYREMLIAVNIWIPQKAVRESPDFALKYAHSFFWGGGIVSSMVPKDVEPYTSIEAVLTTLMTFCGLLLNSLVISSFASAFAAMDSKKELAGKQLDTIRSYLVIKQVPADLRARILEYYEYRMTSSQSLYTAAHMFDMPPNLSAQLSLYVNRRIVQSAASFFADVSDAALIVLLDALVPEVFVPGQVIVSQGLPLRSVFFINKGLVQLFTDIGTESEHLVATLGDSESFGLDDFRKAPVLKPGQLGNAESPPGKESGAKVSASARAVTYCDVMVLAVDELSRALEHDAQENIRREAERAERAARREGKRPSMASCANMVLKLGRMGRSSQSKGGLPSPDVSGRAGPSPPQPQGDRTPSEIRRSKSASLWRRAARDSKEDSTRFDGASTRFEDSFTSAASKEGSPKPSCLVKESQDCSSFGSSFGSKDGTAPYEAPSLAPSCAASLPTYDSYGEESTGVHRPEGEQDKGDESLMEGTVARVMQCALGRPSEPPDQSSNQQEVAPPSPGFVRTKREGSVVSWSGLLSQSTRT